MTRQGQRCGCYAFLSRQPTEVSVVNPHLLVSKAVVAAVDDVATAGGAGLRAGPWVLAAASESELADDADSSDVRGVEKVS